MVVQRDGHEELIELLNELRVVLPGVQVLFAFLLTIPFTGRFGQLTDPQEGAFSIAFLAAAFALVMLMTPPAYHRSRFRAGDEERMLRTANRLTLGGIGCVGIALVAAVYLVADLLKPGPVAIGVAAVVGVSIVVLWAGLPAVRIATDGRARTRRRTED
jgi:Ni/Fe-hydrogenase subunit HybB-like protein